MQIYRKLASQVLELKKTDLNSTFPPLLADIVEDLLLHFSFQKGCALGKKKELADSIFDGKKVGYAT